MKKLTILLLLFVLALSAFSQNRKDLAVSVSAGKLNNPDYKNARARGFYSFGFDYYLSKKQILSVNYLTGTHRYLDDILSNEPVGGMRSDGTNSSAEYRAFSVMYKYKIVDNKTISVVPGVGAGLLTHTREFPYSEVNKSYPKTSSWTDIVFPVNLDVNFKICKHVQAGVSGGLLVHPDYPVIAVYAGPKLSYIID